MQHYNIDLADTMRLRALIDEYGRMQRLEGMTPQARGQRLNELVAELLQCWGLARVEANVRSVGEIDVTFPIDGIRFLLEAKWERSPVDFGPLAKLRGRITQRFIGTRGVFLSMSGYTPQAQGDLLLGQQPDMLLLDSSHLEALLFGFLSPHELFTELVDRASYRGEIYTPIHELVPPRSPAPLPTFATGPSDTGAILNQLAPGVQAETILQGTEPQEAKVDGLAVDAQDRLLLTVPSGIVRVAPGSGEIDWAVPIPGCRSAALPRPDGSILFIRGAAVLRWDGAACQIVASGFTEHTALLPGPDDETWVFDHLITASKRTKPGATLTRLVGGLGQEERHELTFESNLWAAAWLSARRFFLTGDDHFGTADLDHTATGLIKDQFASHGCAERGSIRVNDHTVLTTTCYGAVLRLDSRTGRFAHILLLGTSVSGGDLTIGPGKRAYLLAHRGTPKALVPVVIRLSNYGG